MRLLVFGTYDLAAHPRVGIIADGLRAHGFDVGECNAPLGLSTAERVAMLAQPWRVPVLVMRLARRWLTLARRARGGPDPDFVLVGYLGHFDVHLARLLFRAGRRRSRRVPIILDHLISAGDTARDRRLSGGFRQPLLRAVDAAALGAATLVVVDTEEHRDALSAEHREGAIVVPVGAPDAWFGVGHGDVDAADRGADGGSAPSTAVDEPHKPLRVVFYGLFTPLQGTVTIGEALAILAGQGVDIATTMIGGGQDGPAARRAAGPAGDVTWLDWVPADELPGLVAEHDVCLGIFGTGPKALRVVPNKVYQGAAAGCAVVTSDTPPQRRAFGDAAAGDRAGGSSAAATRLTISDGEPADLATADTTEDSHAHATCLSTPDANRADAEAADTPTAVLVPPGDAEALAAALRRLAEDRGELTRMQQSAHVAARRAFTPMAVTAGLADRIDKLGK